MITIVNTEVGKDDSRHLRRLSLTLKDIEGKLAAYELAATAMAVICQTELWRETKKIEFSPDPKGKREYLIKTVMKFEAENSITNQEIFNFVDFLEREIDNVDLGFNKKTRP